MTTTALPRNLRALLAARGVREVDVARELDLSKSAMSRRMNGAMEFRVGELQAIAEYLEVPLEQLLAPAIAEASA